MKPFNSEKAQFYYDTAIRFQNALVKSSNQLLEYEDKIRTLKNENTELKTQVDSLVANLAAAHEDRNEEAKSVFLAKQVEIPELLRENAALRAERDAARKLLDTHVLRSDLFSYLAWLEDHRDHGDFNVKGKDYLILASDNTTCWGKTFMEAVQVAEQHDRKLFDAARKEAQP